MGKNTNLNVYLENVSDRPFEWGVHDCFTFTNNAFRAMYGVGYADAWMGRYMSKDGTQPRTANSLRREFKVSDIIQGLSSVMTRVDQPVFGSLVTTSKNQRWITGIALGISIGSRAIFLSTEGLTRLNIEDVESAWVL
tara:strand:- start:47 stop:460 length:414 start_codon:yes stop_codon:yes gene_type:complete